MVEVKEGESSASLMIYDIVLLLLLLLLGFPLNNSLFWHRYTSLTDSGCCCYCCLWESYFPWDFTNLKVIFFLLIKHVYKNNRTTDKKVSLCNSIQPNIEMPMDCSKPMYTELRRIGCAYCFSLRWVLEKSSEKYCSCCNSMWEISSFNSSFSHNLSVNWNTTVKIQTIFIRVYVSEYFVVPFDSFLTQFFLSLRKKNIPCYGIADNIKIYLWTSATWFQLKRKIFCS